MHRFPDRISCLMILFGLLFLCYSNSFHSSWHLDDLSNILNNRAIQIQDLTVHSLLKSTGIQKANETIFFRPFANLTFAVNWYFNEDRVFGYHFINILIHVLVAFLLFCFLKEILTIYDDEKTSSPRSNEWIAFLSTLLWALNPIQTQAVVYIVQRMAQLSALFYLLGMYLYVLGRRQAHFHYKYSFYLGTALCYLIALGSKENALMMPFSIILIEIIFIRKNMADSSREKARIYGLGAVFLVFGAAFLVAHYRGANLFGILNGYGIRPFSLYERLLTEPRVILFYLTQILYPIPSRLSIVHDFETSTSMLDPVLTLPAIILVVIISGAGIYTIRKTPLFSFAILFYFLNHLIESTIIPLEIAFEHRNYLPSMFLFLPITAFLFSLLAKYRYKSKKLASVLTGFLVFFPLLFGSGTYVRNFAWASEESLWLDAMAKAPRSSRPLAALAVHYQDRNINLDQALILYRKALELEHTRKDAPVAILNNMAFIYYKLKDYERAVKFYELAIEMNPKYYKARHDLAAVRIKLGDYRKAGEDLNQLLVNADGWLYVESLGLKGQTLLLQGRTEEAIKILQNGLKISPDNVKMLYCLGVACSRSGDFQRADNLLKTAHQLSGGSDITIVLHLLENSLKSEDFQLASLYAEYLIHHFKIPEIRARIQSGIEDPYILELDVALLSSFLFDHLHEYLFCDRIIEES